MMIRFNTEQTLLPNATDLLKWSDCPGASLSLALSQAIRSSERFFLIVTADTLRASQLEAEINFFSPGLVRQFPDWEILPYDNFSPHEDIISERLRACYELKNTHHGGLIIPISTLMHRLPPTDYIDGQTFIFKLGDEVDREALRERLTRCAYQHVSQVMAHGEFSIRGSVIDIFPMGSDLPIRLDCFDDEIEHIKTFDPDDQRSLEPLESIRLLPAKEFPLTEDAISLFRRQWRQTFSGNPLHCSVYESVSKQIAPAGIEYYLPLFFTDMASLFDYLPTQVQIVRVGDIHQQADHFMNELNHRHEQLSYDVTHPILSPDKIALNTAEVFQHFNQYPQISIDAGTDKHQISLASQPLPEININYKAEDPLLKLKAFCHEMSKCLIVAESSGRREVIIDLCHKHQLEISHCHNWQAFLDTDKTITITEGLLETGFRYQDFAVITENELFTNQVKTRYRKQKTIDPDVMIRDLTELQIGQPVVHLQHGVGRYLGLERINASGVNAEYISIEYAENDKVYVPVTSLHLISRYTGHDMDHPPLHKLGHDKWSKAKRKAMEKIHDVAVELLEVYAKREAHLGTAFNMPGHAYEQFTSEFPYELTPDQQTAVDHVIKDMTQKRCMDRLICGDVGFGKTEVALRASFIAAYNGKQVAVLVPTTLLAGQHFQTFCDRFADFPIRIELLSRFKTAKEQAATLEALAKGKVDIVVGTHKLLQQDVKFSDLGLLVVDEEHRFGVKQKEKIKALRSNVDILTMTATPIPRTLNMSMAGMRDISIIATPPEKRLSIKTFLIKNNPHMVREAVLREIMRGGQVFYLHNNVDTIKYTAQTLAELIPEANIRFAHGQMRERELENTMSEFYHRRFNVLVCTTIVENGIDLPTANTIIIDKADHFGLAQLHQLRGRVGRSHHQAYAYLIVPERKAMSSDAKKRLDAFAQMDDLGAGFSLAIHDLEIRGSGEILGEDQSGHIDTIGFSLYMELLDRTVKSLKDGKKSTIDLSEKSGPDINCQVSALIPDEYMPDIHQRLTQYKRIATATSTTELRELQVEMIDRFGLLPAEVKRLFRVTELKLLAENIGIKKIEASKKGGRIEFIDKPNVDPAKILGLIQNHGNQYQLEGPSRLKFKQAAEDHDARIDFISQLVHRLQ